MGTATYRGVNPGGYWVPIMAFWGNNKKIREEEESVKKWRKDKRKRGNLSEKGKINVKGEKIKPRSVREE